MGIAGKNDNVGQGTQQSQGQQGMQADGGIGSPITNEAYNIVSALHAKLEGLEAYRKYSKDSNARVWQELTQTEIQAVGTLVDELERLVRDGKFRLQQPGKANA